MISGWPAGTCRDINQENIHEQLSKRAVENNKEHRKGDLKHQNRCVLLPVPPTELLREVMEGRGRCVRRGGDEDSDGLWACV